MRQRHVQVEPQSSSFSRFVRIASVVGHKCRWIRVYRDGNHVITLVKDTLCAVAVVNVDINDTYAAPEDLLHSGGGDGRVVDETEAARALRGSVMTRWTADAIGMTDLDSGIDRRDGDFGARKYGFKGPLVNGCREI